QGNAGWITPSISAPIPAPGLTWTSLKWMLSKDSPLYIKPTAVPAMARWLWRFWRFCNPRDHFAGLRAQATLNQLTLPAFDALADAGIRMELHRDGLLFLFLDRHYMERARAEFDVMKEFGYSLPEVLGTADLQRIEPILSDQVMAGFTVQREYHVRPESLSDG